MGVRFGWRRGVDRRAGLGPAAAGDRVWRRCGSGVAGQVLAGQVWVAGQVRMAARLGWGWLGAW